MIKQRIICENCDSEYIVEYDLGCVSDELKYCIFCKDSGIEVEDITDEE